MEFDTGDVPLPHIYTGTFTLEAKSASVIKLEAEIIGNNSLGYFPNMNDLVAFAPALHR